MYFAIRVIAVLLLAVTAGAQTAPLFRGPLLHAHNAYPEGGKWTDRIDRALATGLAPVAIEQDLALAWRNGIATPVLAHDDKLAGNEPTLDDYFFKRVQPLMERALAEGVRARWPLLILHLDFKTNEPAHHRAVWQLLQRYQAWLTTAPVAGSAALQPVTPGPLLVLTENGAGQEAAFSTALREGDRLLIFGTPPAAEVTRIEDPERRARAVAAASPETLIPSPPTNYRRWVNLSWQAIELGGPSKADSWTSTEAARLKAIVDRAHALGFPIRFYALNGYEPAKQPELSASYNFGSLDAAYARWHAAMAAGVDLIATDQYEALGARLAPRKARR
jgi:hypothetical protein